MASSTSPTSTLRGLRPFALPLLVAAGGGAGGWLRNRLQARHLFNPVKYPHGIWMPSEHGLPARDVWFASEDGTKLHAWWVPRARARGTVLYCHGNNGNISTRVGALAHLSSLGLNVFAFDYRGYGRSHGSPSEEGLYQDARAAHDYLSGVLGQRPESILLFGHSLGGAIAIETALHRPVGGLVVQSSFTHVRDMAKSLFPRSPLFLVARNQFRSLDKVQALAVPKLFIHGMDDPTVPFEMGRRLFEAAAEPKEWHPIARAGHNDVYRPGGWRYHRRLRKFCRRCLS